MNALIALALFLVITVLGQAGNDAQRDAQIEQEAYDKKITFTMPLEYSATVSQCNKDGCKTRYYYPRSK